MLLRRLAVAGAPPRHCRCLAAPTSLQPGSSTHQVLQDIVQLQEQAVARAPRFYMPELPLSSSQQGFQCQLDGEEGKHAVKVLRLKEGDQVQLCDGKGTLVQCALTAVDKGRNRAWLESVAAPVAVGWEGPRWCLAVACTTLKGGRAEWLVEKATELGAAELIPVVTARSQPTGPTKNKYKKAASSDEEGGAEYSAGRLERVAVAATKQCLRTHMLHLHAPQTVQQVAQLLQAGPHEAYLAVAGAPPLVQALNKQAGSGVVSGAQQPRYLLVGPEGDWTPQELQQLVDAGALPVGLGDLRLRTETAAIALLAAARLLCS